MLALRKGVVRIYLGHSVTVSPSSPQNQNFATRFADSLAIGDKVGILVFVIERIRSQIRKLRTRSNRMGLR